MTLVLFCSALGQQHTPLEVFEGHTDVISSVAFSPDGNRIVSSAWDNNVILWDVNNPANVIVLEGHTGDMVRSATFSPDGNRIVSGSDDSNVILWDVNDPANVVVLEGHTSWVWSVAFSPDGNRIVSGSMDKDVILWDVDY
ncbi:MAG: hypothetical protein AAF708_01955 [Deinococcota bacterium]